MQLSRIPAYIFLILIVGLLFISPTKTFADGETYTWTADGNIQMSGGDMFKTGLLLVPPVLNTSYRGVVTVKDGSDNGCDLSISVNISADRKLGLIVAASPQQTAGTDNQCSGDIAKKYLNKQFDIGGDASCPNETDAQRNVKIIIVDPDEGAAPDKLTITVGGAKIEAKKGIVDGSAYYGGDWFVPAGDFEVCATPLLKCEKHTKIKCKPQTLTFGESDDQRIISVDLTIKLLKLTGQDCRIGPYTLQLKKKGAIVKTIKSGTADSLSGKPEKDASGGTSDTIAKITENEFEDVDRGEYEVCVVEAKKCKKVTKAIGIEGVALEFEENDTTEICNADGAGGKYQDQKLPPPPKPPCLAEGGKGQCLTVATAFGKMNTDPAAFVTNVFAILLSISGGVGALLIIRAGYRIMISQGKPEQLQQGRDDLIAAIVGMLFLIFSFVVLEVIGVDILALPGFK